MLISVSCGSQTSFVQILISLPAGISLSFSRDQNFSSFCLFCFFVLVGRKILEECMCDMCAILSI